MIEIVRRTGFTLMMLAALSASAEVSMPAIFGDNMVLQSGRTIPIWGTANPGETIRVALGKRHAKTKADEQGNWRVDLKPTGASTKGTELTVEGDNRLTFHNVLVGDVWVGSGQSNMEFKIENASTGREAIATANNPSIRLFIVPHQTAAYPKTDINPVHAPTQGKWLVCSPKTLGTSGFSAVAYFFGRDIQSFTHNPEGLIESSWGGTSAEAWTTYQGLQSNLDLSEIAARHAKFLAGYDAAVTALPQTTAAFEAKDEEWKKTVRPANEAALKQWQEQVDAAKLAGITAPPRPQTIGEPQAPDPTGGPGQPTALYNGMIAPLIPYAIKGILWYQGEANYTRAPKYRPLFAALISSWRQSWAQGDFPFLFVQLPDHQLAWGPIREAQAQALSLPNTGMAITIDVGTLKNIHPPYKEIVGQRLALVGEHVAYGQNMTYTGPTYRSMKVEGGTVRITFDNVGSGLTIAPRPISGPDVVSAPTDALQTFVIAGEDKIWHPATATIDGNEVLVSSPEVPTPVAVRYGWDPPPVCNLYNKENLPAAPFRTDDWQ